MRIGLVGYGLIGRQRWAAVQALARSGLPLTYIGHFDPNAAEDEAGKPSFPSLDALLEEQPDWLLVATPHDVTVETLAQLSHTDCNVLIEKPLGRSFAEANALVQNFEHPEHLHVGFNYRHFLGIAALLQDVRDGRFGELVSISATLGHGGSPGDETTWKLDPDRAGGGCLIDPGVHILDLLLQLAPAVQPISSHAWQGFWSTGIEEQAMIQLAAGNCGVAVDLSIVRWRSTFRLEVFGVDGYGIVEGRGRSYGPQTYRRGKRWGWQSGVSQSESEELVCETSGDDVFERELRALLSDSPTFPSVGTAHEALEVMALLDQCRELAGVKVWQ